MRQIMNGIILKKDLIFFNPGKPGAAFVHVKKRYINPEMLIKTQKFLMKETKRPVVYTKERRLRIRHQPEEY